MKGKVMVISPSREPGLCSRCPLFGDEGVQRTKEQDSIFVLVSRPSNHLLLIAEHILISQSTCFLLPESFISSTRPGFEKVTLERLPSRNRYCCQNISLGRN